MGEQVFSFGSFQLFPDQRLLLRAGKPLRLGSRAFDLLIALIARAGEIVSKEDLIAVAWPDTFVEETNLRVHIAALRKALGDGSDETGFITNVPGRGYCFVAPTRRESVAPEATAAVKTAGLDPRQMPAHNLPVAMARIIGRDEIVAALAAQLPRCRLLTITGSGGIGKTRVALAVAQAVERAYDGGIAFVDLTPVEDPLLVPSALAAVLGTALRADAPMENLVAGLQGRRKLVLLDSCEHVVDAAALMAEELLRRVPELDIMVTSREPLRAEGEWVHRLPPLGLPEETQAPATAIEALRFPAVQLFVERASACLGGYELSDADAPLVAEICRRLDGIALAIELATGHIDTIGIRGLAASLDDCFRVLTRGRRTAFARHRTLRATLDWSYRILPPIEQILLRRLAIFNGCFTPESAQAVASAEDIPAAEVDDGIANLAAKSLVAVEATEGAVHYRLLETTRAYGREKLDQGDEVEPLRRRHAEYHRALFERAEAEWETRPTPEWQAIYARQLGNLRTALDWAFSPSGDPALGVALTVAAVPLWHQLSLVDECLAAVRRALAALDSTTELRERRTMQLHAALGWPQMHAAAGIQSGAASWRKALDIAERLGDIDYQLRALWALWVDRINSGEPRASLDHAERFCDLAARTGEPADLQIGDRLRARSLHLMGDQSAARRHVERMLDRYVAPLNRSHVVRFQYDQRVTARNTLARILWVQGSAGQALRKIEDNVATASSLNHASSLCHTLADAAGPIALLAGDLEAAERYTSLLQARTQNRSFDVWHANADCFRGEILIARGQIEAGIAILRPALERLRLADCVLYQAPALGVLAQALARIGRAAEGLDAVESALAQCARSGEGWYLAELQRVRAEILIRLGAEAPAEAGFLESLETARRQGALSWELRTAISLAGLWRDHGRDGRSLLGEIRGRFAVQETTPDLTRADALLRALAA